MTDISEFGDNEATRYSLPLPRLVLGAPRSGEGKTTVALALMAALRRLGHRVQGFKVGPDYIDTGFQRVATGQPGRNLDLWMMGREGVLGAFQQAGARADISVIEGVMGLFDGHRDGFTPTSTADVASLLGAPVILVIDMSRTAATAGPLALGCKNYRKDVHIGGVILNRWRTGRSASAVQAAFDRAEIPILGTLPPLDDSEFPSRHLGLVTVEDLQGEAAAIVDRLAEAFAANTSLAEITSLARSAQDLRPLPRTAASPASRVRIGVARDPAFCFYYEENIEILEKMGAEIVCFSPLQDREVPPADGLYFGGGYPEVHADILSKNLSFLSDLRRKSQNGMPIFAECGGFMYLCSKLQVTGGRSFSMANLVPKRIQMAGQLQRLGYCEAVFSTGTWDGLPGKVVRGHEFHYSQYQVEDVRHEAPGTDFPAFIMADRQEGWARGNILASYIHLHFAGCPWFAEKWLEQCSAYAERAREQKA